MSRQHPSINSELAAWLQPASGHPPIASPFVLNHALLPAFSAPCRSCPLIHPSNANFLPQLAACLVFVLVQCEISVASCGMLARPLHPVKRRVIQRIPASLTAPHPMRYHEGQTLRAPTRHTAYTRQPAR